MEIGLVYSKRDRRQTEARDFLRRYVQERGVLARIIEEDRDVISPTLVINGHTLRDLRKEPRGNRPGMYPAIKDIAAALERHLW